MTKQELVTAFRGRMLLHLTEAYACRHAKPSDLGLLIDKHAIDCKRLLEEIYDAINPPDPIAPINGHTNGRLKPHA